MTVTLLQGKDVIVQAKVENTACPTLSLFTNLEQVSFENTKKLDAEAAKKAVNDASLNRRRGGGGQAASAAITVDGSSGMAVQAAVVEDENPEDPDEMLEVRKHY